MIRIFRAAVYWSPEVLSGYKGSYPVRPSCGAGIHPTGSSTLFTCVLCHDPTLQSDRLPSVTTTVTNRTFHTNLPFVSITGTLGSMLSPKLPVGLDLTRLGVHPTV